MNLGPMGALRPAGDRPIVIHFPGKERSVTEARELLPFLSWARQEVDRILDRLLPRSEEPPAALHTAMRYALFAGGKRLRPALTLAACEALGGAASAALAPAAALEMIHTYSLIHDDLPCMDDDDLRRGRPTCHKVHGEAVALLAGDALLTAAFGVLAAEVADPDQARELAGLLARAAGSLGMVGGQVLDLEGEGAPPGLDRVEAIHRRKTAALLAACLEAGAVAAGASPERRALMAEAGLALGLAFQIQDDVLDETSDAAALGKTPGKDRRTGKQTWPACVGLDSSRAEAERQAGTALALLERAGAAPGALRALVTYAVHRSH